MVTVYLINIPLSSSNQESLELQPLIHNIILIISLI